MSNYRKGWLAIVCAHRKEEDDLQSTLESAAKSAGAGAVIYAVEDKDKSGPGRNRHRGIEAAKDAEAVILIDAHMRFQGDVLRRMGKQVKTGGGLLVPFCWHNAECAIGTINTKGAGYYAGARIAYKCTEGAVKTSLAAKWSKDPKAGPRSCVMGACYAFRRDWYYRVGQPLSMLTGWGCDEELLSIACWMSGTMPEVIYGHVAHRWRERTPWPVSHQEQVNARHSHSAMINTIVTDPAERADLDAFGGLRGWKPSPESERFRAALLTLPRSYNQWRDEVCDDEETDGRKTGKHPIQHALMAQHVKNVSGQGAQVPRHNVPNIVVPLHGVACPKCKHAHDPYKLRVTHTFPNGNRRHICQQCGTPFISRANILVTP